MHQRFRVASAKLIDVAGRIADFNDAEYETLQIECEERVGSDEQAAAADYADYRYEQHRDRQMMEKLT